MKKIISALLAAAVISVSGLIPAMAADEAVIQNATFCFDNDTSLSMWETYGSVKETGFELSISGTAESGRGSLGIVESCKGNIADDNKFGGAYITAEALGLENFKGCTIQASVMFDSQVGQNADSFTMFSDGIVWVSTQISSDTAGRWSKVSLTVPDNADNTKIGFTIPVYSAYEGNVAYIDNLVIYNSDGTIIANIGDQQSAPADAIVPVSLGGRITLIVVLVVIIAIAALCARFVIVSLKKKFT